MTPDELCQQLQSLMQPDTKIVAEATTTLKAYFKEVEAVENLLVLMSQNPNQQIRQMACVYLRKIAAKLWPNLTADQKATTKQLLLQRFVEEPVTIVKKNIADVVGALSIILIPNKEWPELFQFIFKSTQSEALAEQELAMILLSVIIEYFTPAEIEQYYDGLNPIIESYLQSKEPSLRTLSIETVNKLACTSKAIQVLKKYNKLIPLVIDALDLSQEDLIHKVFETFNEFVEIKKVLGPHLPKIIEKALVIAASADYSTNVREVTMLFLELIAEKYARVLIKNHGMNFVQKIIEDGFKIASEDPSLSVAADDQQATPPGMAIQMLHAYACAVPNEKVYPIFKEYLQKYSTSQNEHERAAAVYILGFIADSDACLDPIRDDITPMTNFLVEKMSDGSFVVREAAGEAVGRFAENVGVDFLNKHKQILPCLLKVLKDLQTSKHDMTIQKALCALNELVQNLGWDLKLYLDEVVAVILEYVKPPQFSEEVKFWAMYALSNTILNAEKKILPYMAELCELCNALITGQIKAPLTVKGQALMCAGRLAAACGKEKFPDKAIEAFTQFGLQCLSTEGDNKYELRETSITYFADLSVFLKDDIAPVFDQVLTEILKTCNAADEYKDQEKEGTDAGKSTAASGAGFSLDSDSDAEELEVEIDVNHLDEKSAAVNALGVIGQHCPKLCQGRAQEMLTTMSDLHFYFHPNIRLGVVYSYLQLTFGLMHLAGALDKDDNSDWTKGAPQASPLPKQVADFVSGTVLPYYIQLLEQEEEKEVIESVLERLRDFCEQFGPAAVESQLDKLVSLIIKFLDKKAFCQTKILEDEDPDDLEDVADDDDDEEEEEEGDDGIDHDELILGNVSDLVIALARAYGNEFAPYFEKIAPHLVAYTADNHPKSDRSMALGCLAETFAAASAVIPAYFNDYLQLLEKNSDTQDSKLNRNISYSLGVLAQHAQVQFQPHVSNALTLLQKLHANSSEVEAQDNIVAASCRIIEFQLMPLPADQRPAEYAQLVDSVFQKIPFEGDDAENETVLQFAAKLYEQDQETCLKYMDKIALTCVKSLVDDKASDALTPKVKYQVGEMINKIVVNHAQATLQELESKMSEHEKEELKKYMKA